MTNELQLVLMKELKVTVREFLRNFKSLSAKNEAIVIIRNGKEEGVYIPYKNWENDEKKESFIITEEFLDQFSYHSGITDLSERIDEIYQ